MLAVEPEPSIVTEVLEHARADVADRFLNPGLRPAALARIAGSLSERLARTQPDDNNWLPLCRGLIEFSADVDELRGWLDGTRAPAGLVLDADLAWRVRYRLSVLGALDEDEIEAAYRADPSSHGEQFATKCRAARPDPAAKRAAWNAIIADTELSNYRLWALAEGFWQPEQADLTAEYVARFFAEMLAAAKLRGDLVLDFLIRFLYPRYAASAQTLRLADELLGRDDIDLPLRRRVADFSDDLRRVVAARSATVD
jgi:aminopeptidase N